MSLSASKPYILAADIGTTSTKTLIIRAADGAVIAGHSVEYPMFNPKPNVAEQDPDQICQAVTDGIAAVLQKAAVRGEELLCVSFSSAMHGLIAMDKNGRPMTRLITWADNRAVHTSDEIKRHGGLSIYRRTGTPIHPMSPFVKLVWMKEAMPDIHAAADKFIGIKEYVLYRWFGQYVVDYSIASATGLFNLEQLDWDKDALELAGITPDRLPKPVSTVHVLEGLDTRVAADTGLPQGIPVVMGASDGVLANLGSGAFEEGVWAVSIGTSGAVRAVARKPLTDPEGRLFCYALKEDFWTIGGAINNGGIMFRWVRDTLATLEAEEGRRRGMDPYDYLTELAAGVPAGSGGLIFLPLLAGERAPYWNANARGVFFGLSLAHGKNHMIRSVLEGVMYRIHSVAEALEGLVGQPSEIRASGGFARSPFWRQMLADVTGTPLTVPDAIEASGLGAAQLGLLAMGQVKDFSGVHEWVKAGTRHEKHQEAHATYKRLTPIYQKVYHQLSREFDEIAAFQQEFL